MKIETAIILAGGKATRMGRPKWNLSWKGKTLLEYIYWELAGNFNRVLVSTREKLDIPFQQIVDIVEAGSLGGIYSSLVYIGEPAFFCAVDMPLMNGEVARKIADLFNEELDVVVPFIGQKYEPLAAVYSPRIIPYIKSQILKRNFRIKDIYGRVKTRKILEDELQLLGIEVRVFKNINTPKDYENIDKDNL